MRGAYGVVGLIALVISCGLLGLIALLILSSIALAASPLDGSQWRIVLTTTSAKAKAPSESHVRFEKGKFTAPFFQPKGFPASNYTLTEEKGAPLIWETMQTSETEGSLSWRGQLEGEIMRGLASWQKPDGTVVNYTFTGRKVVEPAVKAAEPAAKAVEPPAPKPKAKPRPK